MRNPLSLKMGFTHIQVLHLSLSYTATHNFQAPPRASTGHHRPTPVTHRLDFSYLQPHSPTDFSIHLEDTIDAEWGCQVGEWMSMRGGGGGDDVWVGVGVGCRRNTGGVKSERGSAFYLGAD
ncbi:hypothetical protein I3843_01G155300 [Carya illinoinensis]|uniref:Uncharacterized protein n=1 Tax=Carya illinoinensis TaxID=32201 RepID=A0A922G4K0_CARIL|nr:hypothetical protein I3842_01G162600 [Carya illinoinensis]KAG7996354.1 hypothetical protein I3843_01G155300 [Carya illinoinensis]